LPIPEYYRSPELADDVQNETDDNADDDARGQRKIEREVLFLDQDIARELAQKRDLLDKKHHEADEDEHDPDHDDDFRHFSHSIVNPFPPDNGLRG
jgi:hypothetical protein